VAVTADAKRFSAANARGTDHDIPSALMCGECHHNVPDKALGFGAVQLAHAGPGTTLATLVDDDRLSAPPIAPGHPAQSAIAHRMGSRNPLVQMPPLASEVVDEMGVAAIEAWITALAE
jgi:hypothetical protein